MKKAEVGSFHSFLCNVLYENTPDKVYFILIPFELYLIGCKNVIS